ncbi:hypothetical protein BGZ68_000875 [Mortierella alpina]|nr:hypothetical protein BGZ68_000875 [Mortierella alpina]
MSRRSSRLASTATVSVVPIPSTPKPVIASKRSARQEPVSSNSDTESNTPKLKKKRAAAKEPTVPEPLPDDGLGRCQWAASTRYPLLQKYHDTEWCIPGGFDRSNRYLFEMIILEGAQAGLSWSTVLHKRDAYRAAYDNFDYNLIANTYTSPSSNERLLQTNIVKNKLKVEASMINARAFRDLLNELYPDQAQPADQNGFWQFLQAYRKPESKRPLTGGTASAPVEAVEYLTSSPESDRLSADLKQRGFKFVGTTIMYAYLQAVGMEPSGTHHSAQCFKHHKNALAS